MKRYAESGDLLTDTAESLLGIQAAPGASAPTPDDTHRIDRV